ncbi:MAG: hypothetical protein FWH55_10075 [Oscillospiraceae bacterium]|nr:hypothetical protein [Oscillospiraceae bacterium]
MANNSGKEPDFSVRYIRTNGYIDGAKYPVINVINSRYELEQYYNQYKDTYDFASQRSGLPDFKEYVNASIGFADAMEGYPDEFFRDNYLVIVMLEEGSGSIRHKVERIDENGNIFTTRLVPEIGTADMAEWNILITLNKSIEYARFHVIFVDAFTTVF